MTAKPETAAEVLAESIKTAIAHEKESGEFRRSDVLLLLSSAQDAVDALSAQGEAVAGTVVGHDSFGREVIDWNGEEALPAGTKLYTHPAPARVTDMLALARGAWRAGITLGNNICVQESDRENDQDGDCGRINGTAECAKRIREWADPEDAQLVELLNEAGVDTSALTAALEADHG